VEEPQDRVAGTALKVRAFLFIQQEFFMPARRGHINSGFGRIDISG
jgi:hypothetical protein